MALHCERGGEAAPSYDNIHYITVDGGYPKLYNCRFSAEVVSRGGLINADNLKSLMFFAFLLCSCAVHAEVETKYNFGITAEGYNETYEEYKKSTNTKFMQEKATMKGVGLAMEIIFDSNFTLQIRAKQSEGMATYTGSTQTGTYGSLIGNNIPRKASEFSMAYEFNHAYPYTFGLGFVNNTLEDSADTMPSGYYRRNDITCLLLYNQYNVDIGVFHVTPRLGLKYVFGGRQLSGTAAAIGNDVVNYQSTGYGLSFEAPIGYKHSLYSFEVVPFYRFMRVEESSMQVVYQTSTTQYGWVEPQNITTEIGVGMSLIF